MTVMLGLLWFSADSVDSADFKKFAQFASTGPVQCILGMASHKSKASGRLDSQDST